MIPCPVCAEPTGPGATACDACAVRLAWTGAAPMPMLPPIRPGETLAALSFASVPLPGHTDRAFKWTDGDSTEGVGDGVLVNVIGSGIRWFTQPYLRIRDACVRAQLVGFDEAFRFRIAVRRQKVGDANVWYELAVAPHPRTYRIARLFSSPEHFETTKLADGADHPAIARTGAPNIIELRIQGATLEGWVNGARTCAIHDPALGIGGIAIGVESTVSTKILRRAVVHWLEIRAVAP